MPVGAGCKCPWDLGAHARGYISYVASQLLATVFKSIDLIAEDEFLVTGLDKSKDGEIPYSLVFVLMQIQTFVERPSNTAHKTNVSQVLFIFKECVLRDQRQLKSKFRFKKMNASNDDAQLNFKVSLK